MLAHFKLETIPILEIKDCVFMLRSIKQRAFFWPVFLMINGNLKSDSQTIICQFYLA